MRKIKLTRANKSILLKALGDYYYRQRAMNTGWRETGYLILKVDSLSASKKAAFTSEEVYLARNAVNQLRNKKIKQGQYTDATDEKKSLIAKNTLQRGFLCDQEDSNLWPSGSENCDIR